MPSRLQEAVYDDAAGRATIRRINLGLILRHLRTHGPRSRTQVARDLGLPNSTVSKLIGELVERSLLAEGEVDRAGAVGRPQQAVELAARTVCGVGVEISVDYGRVIGLDLRGDLLIDERIALDVARLDPEEVLDAVAGLVAAALNTLDAAGTQVAGVTVAAPGEIDRDAGVVNFASNLGWSNLPLVTGLTERLGPGAPPVRIDNDARLGAMAEYLLAAPTGIHDLIYITGEVGVGGGIVIGGQLLRGAAGYAGEIGHMPLDPDPQPCACGRRGCWETMVGLAALMRYAADAADPVRDLDRDLEDRLSELRERADAGDARTLAALGRIADGLGVGIALLVDILNPRSVILGGWFTFLGQYLLETVRRIVAERVVAPDSGGCEVRLSTLGFTAAARGGAHAALETVFADPASTRT